MPIPAKEHQPTPTSAEGEETAHGFSRHVGWLLLLLLIYILSIGPMERFYSNRPVPAAVVTFYEPLRWLGQNCKPAKLFLDWYVYGVWVRPSKSAS